MVNDKEKGKMPAKQFWWQVKKEEGCEAVNAGSSCPQCHKGILNYDSKNLFNLTCPKCGYVADGSGHT